MKKIIVLLSFLFYPSIFFAKDKVEITSMFAPGGAADVISRHLESSMGKDRYYVVHRTGGLGQIAVKNILNEESIMVVLGPQILIVNPMINKNLNYKSDDLEIIGTIGIMPSVLVCNKKTGILTFNDFMSNRRILSFGSSGFGSNEFLSAEVLNKQLNTKHKVIPYPHGGATAILDLIGGHIDCMFANYPTIRTHLSNENLIILLTSHDLKISNQTWRSIFKEDFPTNAYVAVMISRFRSEDFKNKIIKDLKNAFQNPNFNQQISDLGFIPAASTDRNFIKDYHSNNDRIRNFITNNNIPLMAQ